MDEQKFEITSRRFYFSSCETTYIETGLENAVRRFEEECKENQVVKMEKIPG